MRRALAWAAALVFAGSAAAQDVPAPDVPTGPATLEGRVLDEARKGVSDVGVILYSLAPDGEPGLRQMRTGEDGGFRFEGVSNDPEVVYLIGTRVGGVPFGARAVFQAGETTRSVEIEVSQPSRDADAVRAGAPQLRFERGCTHLRIHHEQPLTNASSRVVFVPPDARDGTAPLFELDLPEGATEIETPVGTASESFDRDGRRLRFFGPVYPGTTSVEFSYGLPLGSTSSLRIGFPDGADGVRVFVPPTGAQVSGEGLREEGEIALASGAQRALGSGAIAPGGTLQLDVALDPATRESAVEIAEARLWLELDDAALDVNEAYQLRVDGDDPLAASSGAPLLCIPLPAGAESLRFSNASLAMGLSRDPDGALALSGPVPAGDSNLSLRYRLPVAPGPVTFSREFQSDVELLTLLVADTGVVPETPRLHRRRPIRTEDRSYLHLEGFGIESGERIDVALRPLPQRQGLPSLALSGVLLLVAAGAFAYLIAPLRGASVGAPARGPAAADAAAKSHFAQEREAVYAAIDDLDDDFETGKLSDEDHARMRAELRARAVGLLQAERSADAPDARDTCPGCGATPSSGDRFCSQCGTALATACPGCGAKASSGDRFCSQCGTALRAGAGPGGPAVS